VAPCHRADGRLVKPDEPVAALDRCFSTSWPLGRTPRLLAGEAVSEHGAGTWRYVFAANPSSDAPLSDVLSLDELGPGMVWDWRAGAFVDVAGGWRLDLAPLEWAYAVVVPMLARGALAVVGDPSLHATAGDARIADVIDDGDSVRVTVLGAGETVALAGWSADVGQWRQEIEVPARGWTTVRLT
jgi:hypothetical protein